MSILVLLATYNGESFLREQLVSLNKQTANNLQVLVIDDGSVDGTTAILQEWEGKLPMTFLSAEQKLGLPEVFLHLLFKHAHQHDYYAFCDQDDYWYPEKLETALREIGDTDQPVLWVCNFSIIDSEGNLKESAVLRSNKPGLGNALVECIGPGCAMVWNRALMEKMQQPELQRVLMHDWWVYLSAAALGRVIVSKRSLLKYRVHGRNAVGVKRSLWSRLRRQFAQGVNSRPSLESQAQEGMRLYGDYLDPEVTHVLRIFVSGNRLERLMLVIRGKVWRSRSWENLLLVLRLLFLRRSFK